MKSILIIEDDPDIRELISFNLEMSGYTVYKARDKEEGLFTAATLNPDLIILDLMLSRWEGLKVYSCLKKEQKTRKIPIILLMDEAERPELLDGIESGVDDYISKPYHPGILLTKVRSVLRRIPQDSSNHSNNILMAHNLTIDVDRHETRLDGENIHLSATEYSILRFLIKKPGWVFSRNQIITSIRSENYPVTPRSVDVQILGIRKKLGESRHIIETVRGHGYRIKEY
jgi:two-component system phosphate regulon response regulator PhoB